MSERERLQRAIETLQAERAGLGDAIVDAALAPMREKLLAIGRESSVASDRAAERKHVTVMFADLSGFTALSETTDPEWMRSLVNGCFNALVPVVEAYGGVVDKFIGDAIMALFGAPVAHESDAEHALSAALDMIDALEAFNRTHDVALDMHFGIATGRVVAGGLGSDGHQQYSVMGDAVNLAARLEELSEPGQILVGPVTHRLTAPLFRFDSVPSMRLKGKAEHVAVHRLLGRRAKQDPARGAAGLHSPLVGREVEMQAMLSAAYDLAQGTGGVLGIVGEAGIGKSRLVGEARRSTSDNVLWIVGHAASHAHGGSYALARRLLDGLIGTSVESSRREVNQALHEFLRTKMEGKGGDIYPYLARMCDVPLEPDAEQRLRELLPEALQARIRAAFGELIRDCALRRPMVLVCEDIHWSDPSSLGLLDSLVPLTSAIPLLLLLVFRADEGEAWKWHQRLQREHGTHYRVLELSPLNRADSGTLVDKLLRSENLPDTTRELILGRSEGNPFFLEELLRSLIESGLVRDDDGRVPLTEAAAQLNVPDTVQSVVAARIDRLATDAKRVLQTASVLGRIFQKNILHRLLHPESTDARFDSSLSELVEREFLLPHGAAEYVFKHAITRNVAYESLLVARRKQLHSRTAELMEAVYAERLDELAPTLAYHLVAAESRDKALHYLTLAADRARETYSNAEAIGFYRTAIEQVDELRRQSSKAEAWREKAASLRENMGGMLSISGRVDEALETYTAARSFVPDTDEVTQGRLYRRQSIALSGSRRIPEMLAANERAVAMLGAPREAADQGWWQEWVDLQIERIWGFYLAGRIPELMELVAQARPVIDEHGAPAQRARLLEAMVLADLRRFRYFCLPDETLENARRQLDAAKASGVRLAIARASGVRGFVHLFRGELPEAEEYFNVALKEAEHIGDMETQLIVMSYMTLIARRRDDVAVACNWAERTLALSKALKNPFYQASSLGSMGWVAWREGDERCAQAHLQESMAIAAKIPTPIQFMAVGPLLALATKHRDWSAAVGYAQALLHPTQQKLPDDIQDVLDQAVSAWNESAAERAGALLVDAVRMMREQAIGYV